jgi:acetylornithine deacetylase/succinyl-diaminopimelate desuccinylase-like protein
MTRAGRSFSRSITAALASAALAFAAGAPAQPAATHEALARDIYRELVEIRTVHPDGDNSAAARAMARRLLDAGFDAADVQVLEPAPLKGNLVARLRGTGQAKPVLLLAHIDVVDAKKEDWSDGLDPWKLTERDGHFYGRGVMDDKAMAAAFVANLIRYKREGLRPRRDIVLALTADEEGGTHNGVQWLLGNHRQLIDAQFALNEGGASQLRDGRPYLFAIQVSEKMYLSFELEATNSGGHSSLPRADNAIYDLAGALERIASLQLPARLTEVARAFAAKTAQAETGALAEALSAVGAGRETAEDLRVIATNPSANAQMRTTCVATRLEGGHADNALPQRAKATVNCRLLPGEGPKFVQGELERAAGPKVRVSPKNPLFASEATDTRSAEYAAIARAAEAMWPGVQVMPIMSAGATDGSRLRNAGIPVYGMLPVFLERGGIARMHGRDERVPVRSFYDGVEYLYRLVADLAAAS